MKKSYNKFYLIGAGGYGKQLSVILKSEKIIKSSTLVDNKLNFNFKKFSRLKDKVNYNIFVGKPNIRENIFNYLKKKNFLYTPLVLSTSKLYTNKISKGCIIEHYVLVSNNVSLGIGCIILTGSIIGHDSRIGNFCNIGTNATISGNVRIGNKVLVGSQSFISNDIKICSNVIIAPGSIVLKNITKPGIYNGNILIK